MCDGHGFTLGLRDRPLARGYSGARCRCSNGFRLPVCRVRQWHIGMEWSRGRCGRGQCTKRGTRKSREDRGDRHCLANGAQRLGKHGERKRVPLPTQGGVSHYCTHASTTAIDRAASGNPGDVARASDPVGCAWRLCVARVRGRLHCAGDPLRTVAAGRAFLTRWMFRFGLPACTPARNCPNATFLPYARARASC